MNRCGYCAADLVTRKSFAHTQFHVDSTGTREPLIHTAAHTVCMTAPESPRTLNHQTSGRPAAQVYRSLHAPSEHLSPHTRRVPGARAAPRSPLSGGGEVSHETRPCCGLTTFHRKPAWRRVSLYTRSPSPVHTDHQCRSSWHRGDLSASLSLRHRIGRCTEGDTVFARRLL